jgi:transposase
MTHDFWLSDDAWAAIEPHLPFGKPIKPRVGVISGILHVLKTRCRWRDCPSKYGPHTTIYNHYKDGRNAASGSESSRRWRGSTGA